MWDRRRSDDSDRVAEAGHTFADGQIRWAEGQSAPRGRGAYTASYLGLVLAITLALVAVGSELNRTPVPVYRVVSGSMEPTLVIGQVVHVDTSAYASHAVANGSNCGIPFRTTDPLVTAIVSPGAATIRLMKIWSLSACVDCGQTSAVVYATPHMGVVMVAPAGAWKATIPRCRPRPWAVCSKPKCAKATR